MQYRRPHLAGEGPRHLLTQRPEGCFSERAPDTSSHRFHALSTLALLTVMLSQSGCTMHAQRREQAEQHWNQMRTDVKHQLAKQQFQRGQIETAIDTVNEAIAIDSSSADPFLLLAHCYMEQGKLASARRAVARAQRCDPQSPTAEYTLGMIAERTDRTEDALTHYRRARSLNNSIADYLVAEAECLAAGGNPEEALALVSENIGRFDSDGTLEMLLGQICLLVGDKETAVHHLRLAIERSGCSTTLSDDPSVCDTLVEEYGKLLSETARYAEAVALLRPYIESHPDAPPSVVAALCAAHLNTHRTDEAKRLLRDEVRRRPNNTRCWMLLARACMETEDYMTARRCANRLERLVPGSAQVHLLHGFVCWKQEDLPAAEGSLRRALSIDPRDALAHCVIGRVLEDAGRRAAAQEHYRRALQIDPQSVWARRLLGVPASVRHTTELATGAPAERGELP